MTNVKRIVALSAVLAAVLTVAVATSAVGGTIFTVQYRGWTTQSFPPKPKPTTLHKPIAVVIDQTNHRVAYIGLAYTCSAKSAGWIGKIYPNAKIDSKGNFAYRPFKIHMTWIAGHVSKNAITGRFTANRGGCKRVNGTYSLVPGSTWPPKPSP